MSLPIAVPYEVLYYFVIAGGIAVAITAIGALLRLWSWKWIRTVAGVFIAIGLTVLAVSWLAGRLELF